MPDTDWITETPLPALSIFRRVTLFCGPDKTAGCDWAGAALRTGSSHRDGHRCPRYSLVATQASSILHALQAHSIPSHSSPPSGVFSEWKDARLRPPANHSPPITPLAGQSQPVPTPQSSLAPNPTTGIGSAVKWGSPQVSPALSPIWSGGCCTQALSVIRTDCQRPDWRVVWRHTSLPTGRVTARVTNPPILLVMEFVVYH